MKVISGVWGAGLSAIDENSPKPALIRTPAGAVAPGCGPVYAALDLGTNNCRLLVARRADSAESNGPCELRVVDSFSRIVRLGEGLSQNGRLSETAIVRTLDALDICRDKMDRRRVTRARMIATEACRAAANGQEFIARVAARTGLQLEIIDRETEARLAVAGCASLADPRAQTVLLFDIGGGSTEVVWLTREGEQIAHADHPRGPGPAHSVADWASLECGVVSLAERFGGHDVTPAIYEGMVAEFANALAPFAARMRARSPCAHFHLLGTSGTVTTLAGVYLHLTRYDRRQVDGLWMAMPDVEMSIARLRAMNFDQRAANGCIGVERADLVLAGCAILEAIHRAFPAPRIRIADRGLREGILFGLMHQDRQVADRESADGVAQQ